MEMNISPGLGHFTQWDSMERVEPGAWGEVVYVGGIQFETIDGVEEKFAKVEEDVTENDHKGLWVSRSSMSEFSSEEISLHSAQAGFISSPQKYLGL